MAHPRGIYGFLSAAAEPRKPRCASAQSSRAIQTYRQPVSARIQSGNTAPDKYALSSYGKVEKVLIDGWLYFGPDNTQK